MTRLPAGAWSLIGATCLLFVVPSCGAATGEVELGFAGPAGLAQVFKQNATVRVQYGGGKGTQRYFVEIHRPGQPMETRGLGLTIDDEGSAFTQRVTALLQPLPSRPGETLIVVHRSEGGNSTTTTNILEDVDPFTYLNGGYGQTIERGGGKTKLSHDEDIPLVTFRYSNADDEFAIALKLRLE